MCEIFNLTRETLTPSSVDQRPARTASERGLAELPKKIGDLYFDIILPRLYVYRLQAKLKLLTHL